jgi:hypothetical protein
MNVPDALLHNEAFIAFLDDIKAQREAFIQAMHAAPTERIQQVSGRILMCDEILETGGYRQIEERRRQKP